MFLKYFIKNCKNYLNKNLSFYELIIIINDL